MRKLLSLALVFAMGCVRAPLMTNNSGQSSGQSANSSGNSAGSSMNSGTSDRSANSSGASAQSSQGSQNSSGASQASSASSQQSSQNSGGSSAASAQSTAQGAASSVTVAGSVLLVAVAGGIMTTVFTAADRRAARLERERLQQLQQQPQAPVPQPMPYKVEPIPLEGNPPAPTPPPPAPPAPGFTPAPFPKKTEAWDEQGPTMDAMVMARSWLIANELQLAADLGLGLGPALDDLAYIAGVKAEHRAHFGKVLQRSRARLVVSRELTPQGAATLMRTVGELVMADPLLRGDAVAMLAAR